VVPRHRRTVPPLGCRAERVFGVEQEPRKWLIHDSVGDGEDTEVEGEGVVGELPVIAPGHIHEYQSFCVLKSPSGYMEGQYFFRRTDKSRFAADIPRFLLDAENALGPTS
jgi:uncharacterized protein affecting Mg2+/Co2+ transport